MSYLFGRWRREVGWRRKANIHVQIVFSEVLPLMCDQLLLNKFDFQQVGDGSVQSHPVQSYSLCLRLLPTGVCSFCGLVEEFVFGRSFCARDATARMA